MDWLSSLLHGLRGASENRTTSLDSLLMERVASGLSALLLLITSYFVSRLISRYVAALICRQIDETLGRFAGRLSFYGMLICSALGILAAFGISVTGPMAVLTAAGFAIGLAFQGTLSNFAAGVLLLVFRPFKVGDMVAAGGVMGRVQEIDLFTTVMDTPDNRRLIMPNSAIAGGTIENMTFHAHRRVDVSVGVAYSASLDQTRAALTAAAQSLGDLLVLGEDRGFQVLLMHMGSSSVDWTVRFWTQTQSVPAARERLTQEIKIQLERAGIEIPFPQMQLHFSASSAPGQAVELAESEVHLPRRPRLRRAGGEAA